MLHLLHPSVQAQSAALRREFSAAKPFRHLVIDSFVDPALCSRLIEEFPAFHKDNALNEFGEVGRKAVVTDLAKISPAYLQLDLMLRSKQFLHWIGEVTSIDQLIYDPDYVGGGTHENLEGQDLDLHVDFNYHPKRLWHRRLNLILFLNPEWREEWGGCLELHSDPWHPSGDSDSVRILPLANRCVVFETTESSWHGFTRICLPAERSSLSRKSVAVYIYTKDRSINETAPSHGTIYVPPGLPPEWRPGHTLSLEDYQQLEILIARRDRQIQFLYERELDFSRTLTGIFRSPSFRLGRALTWPLRRLRGRRG